MKKIKVDIKIDMKLILKATEEKCGEQLPSVNFGSIVFNTLCDIYRQFIYSYKTADKEFNVQRALGTIGEIKFEWLTMKDSQGTFWETASFKFDIPDDFDVKNFCRVVNGKWEFFLDKGVLEINMV